MRKSAEKAFESFFSETKRRESRKNKIHEQLYHIESSLDFYDFFQILERGSSCYSVNLFGESLFFFKKQRLNENITGRVARFYLSRRKAIDINHAKDMILGKKVQLSFKITPHLLDETLLPSLR